MQTYESITQLLAHGIGNGVVRWALLLWLDGADERVVLLNARGNNPNECNATERKCWKHGNNGGNGSKTADTSGLSEGSIQRRAREQLEQYNLSTDHPSADDVAEGRIPVKEALHKGFEAQFGGQRIVFFTRSLDEKYDGASGYSPGRLQLIREALKSRKAFYSKAHSGGQTAFIQQGSSVSFGRPIVLTTDSNTGVAVGIMRSDPKYIKKNYK